MHERLAAQQLAGQPAAILGDIIRVVGSFSAAFVILGSKTLIALVSSYLIPDDEHSCPTMLA